MDEINSVLGNISRCNLIEDIEINATQNQHFLTRYLALNSRDNGGTQLEQTPKDHSVPKNSG